MGIQKPLIGKSDRHGNGVSESYLYDGDGARVARVRSGEATYLFMGGLVEVTLALPSGTVTGSRSYYTVEGQVLAMSDGSTTQYLLTDHLGSVVGVVDGSGAMVSEQRYLPFGQVRTDLSGITATDLSFTGQRALTGTGLLDYHARQYDPALRTFIQADSIIPNPYGVQDYNRYLYVHANPVRFTDPSGNRCTPQDGCDNPSGDIMPTPVDFRLLSITKGGRTHQSATDLYQYYLKLFSMKDAWWWNVFPRFTVYDFISLITYYEIGQNTAYAGVIAEAGVRFYIEWTKTKGLSIDRYSLLDWFARYSESAQRRISANFYSYDEPDLNEFSKISIVGWSFANTPNDWSDGWRYDRPFNWGNESVLSTNAKFMYEKYSTSLFLALPGVNPFYIPSGCAWINWQSRNNKLLCPSVVN